MTSQTAFLNFWLESQDNLQYVTILFGEMKKLEKSTAITCFNCQNNPCLNMKNVVVPRVGLKVAMIEKATIKLSVLEEKALGTAASGVREETPRIGAAVSPAFGGAAPVVEAAAPAVAAAAPRIGVFGGAAPAVAAAAPPPYIFSRNTHNARVGAAASAVAAAAPRIGAAASAAPAVGAAVPTFGAGSQGFGSAAAYLHGFGVAAVSPISSPEEKFVGAYSLLFEGEDKIGRVKLEPGTGKIITTVRKEQQVEAVLVYNCN